MFNLRISKPVHYLQKPVEKMNTSDYVNLLEKFSGQFEKAGKKVSNGTIAPVICGPLPADFFTISGKLNRQTLKDIHHAKRSGDLPQKATIQDLYNKLTEIAKEKFSDMF